MATGLAEAGADVVLCARKTERCEEAAAELERELGRARARLSAATSATRPRSRRSSTGRVRVRQRRRPRQQRRDVLGRRAEDHPLEGWQKVIDVNLTGVFLFAQAAGRVMIEQGGGKIVNIASVAAFGGAPPELMNAVAYNASKGGVVGFTRDLATKWAQHGINVNAIAPGWFPSDMNKACWSTNPEPYLEQHPAAPLRRPRRPQGRGRLPRLRGLRLRDRPDADRRRGRAGRLAVVLTIRRGLVDRLIKQRFDFDGEGIHGT